MTLDRPRAPFHARSESKSLGCSLPCTRSATIGVGHVGADVDPNHMDALCVLQMSKWVFAELVRIFHGTTTEEAEATVDDS